jgi:hypothetical protein
MRFIEFGKTPRNASKRRCCGVGAMAALMLAAFLCEDVQAQHDKAKLEKRVGPLYADGTPTQEALLDALRQYVEDAGGEASKVLNDPAFAFDLLEIVGAASGKNLQKTVVQSQSLKPHIAFKNTTIFKSPWKIRHYTTAEKGGQPGYKEIKSTVGLALDGIESKHTNEADWNLIGNVGFSFYVLCIDGEVQNRKFLADSTHYAEYDLADIPLLFVSGDWLPFTRSDCKDDPKPGYRGSGEDVKTAVLLNAHPLDLSDPRKFLDGLDAYFGNFEVKIPGDMNVEEWIEIKRVRKAAPETVEEKEKR